MTENSIRRHRIRLMICGKQVVIFGVWTLIKLVLTYFLDPFQFEKYIYRAGYEEYFNFVKIIVFVILVGYFMIDILIRVYIGRCAKQEARGKKLSIFYIVIACIYTIAIFVTELVTVISSFVNGIEGEDVIMLFSGVVDTITLLPMVLIVVSSIMLRKNNVNLEKEMIGR